MFLSRFFGHGRKIRHLRKNWDRQREKTLKLNEPLKSSLLKKLDEIELNIRTLEEQNLRNTEIARIAKEAEIDLEETKTIIKAKDSYIPPSQNQVQPQNK